MNRKQKELMEEKILALDDAVARHHADALSHEAIENLYAVTSDIARLYADEVNGIREIFDELKKNSGLRERCTKNMIAVLRKHIIEHYNPADYELLRNTQAVLTDYSPALKQYVSGIEKYGQGLYNRNTLDDMRLSIELLCRAICCNEKSLENNYDHLSRKWRSLGVTQEMITFLVGILKGYATLQNESVKHSDNVDENEVEFVVELTSVLLKFFVKNIN